MHLPVKKLVILGLLLNQPLQAGGDITFKKMKKYLAMKGIDDSYSDGNYDKLLGIFSDSLQEIKSPKQTLTEPEDLFRARKLAKCAKHLPPEACEKVVKDHRKEKLSNGDRKEAVHFLEYGRQKLEKSRSSQAVEEKKYAMMLAKNILYGIFSSAYEGRPITFFEALKWPFSRMRTEIPYLNKNERAVPINAAQAQKESSFLTDPNSSDPNRFLSAEELIGKTPEELAKLDVREDHHMWHTERYIAANTRPWANYEQGIEAQVQRYLNTKGIAEAEKYRFDDVRDVVFYKGYHQGHGTHPKIRVQDAYGLEWKLKWGAESFSENVANHLWISIGGKVQDLNYTHTVKRPVVVIFPEELHKNEGQIPACQEIKDYESMKTCLKASKFKFKLPAWIIPERVGVIGEKDLAWIEKRVSKQGPAEKFKRESLLGRAYVTFNETSMEFKGNKEFIHRSGPIAQSFLGSEKDRAMRGLILFNLFLSNYDSKDENTEGILPGIGETGAPHYLQSNVDLGSAFRGFEMGVCGINYYHPNFLRHSMSNKHKLVYESTMAYRPRAAKEATYSDLLWMANKIVRHLTYERITEAVAASDMPDFFQQTLVWKITKRRNLVAKMFDLEHLVDRPDSSLVAPEFSVPLTSREDRLAAAARYHISYKQLNHVLTKAGLPEGKPYIEKLIKAKGTIRKCSHSAIINILEKTNFPSGLSRSYTKPLENPNACKFHKP